MTPPAALVVWIDTLLLWTLAGLIVATLLAICVGAVALLVWAVGSLFK